mgnify:CR=1 FL=1
MSELFIDTHEPKTLKELQGMDKYFIQGRDSLWIPNMIDIMDEDNALIAVGALHVLDLVERLEKKGYTLTPLDI